MRACHRARRGQRWPASRSPQGGTLADSLWPWTPERGYEPRWCRDRADDFLQRWRAAAAATYPKRRCRDADVSTSSSSAAASSAAPWPGTLPASSHSVALVEARGDVGDGTSKANTAILHTGFDASPGIARVGDGAPRLPPAVRLRGHRGIPVERTGALLVAWTQEELDVAAEAARQGPEQRLHRVRDRRCRSGLRDRPRPRAGCARWPDRSRRVDHLHVDYDLAFATEAKARGASCCSTRGSPASRSTPTPPSCTPRAGTSTLDG